MQSTRFGIILGCPRSGTSFLANALRGLPNSEILIGHHLPVTVPHLFGLPLAEEVRQALAYGFRHSLENYLSEMPNARAAACSRWLAGNLSAGELLDAFRRRRRVDLLVYKEPFLAFAPEFAFQALPDARLIHIVRDGRDCANSLVETYDVLSDEKLRTLHSAESPLGRQRNGLFVPWWVEAGGEDAFLAGTPFVRAVWMWKEMIRRCHAFFSAPSAAGSGRVHVVKYEELVRDPAGQAGAIVEFLGRRMDRRIERHFQAGHAGSIGNYRKRDGREIEAATRIAAAELRLHGYL